MHDLINVERYPLDRLDTPDGADLIARCQRELADTGMFNLDELVRPDALIGMLAEVLPAFENAFHHRRTHNIYFSEDISGVAPDHPALNRLETINHTVCADQVADSLLLQLYRWPPLAAFLAAVMEKRALHVMNDPLACVNVMRYGAGEALNWHFDRSEFTTTLLLQSPDAGGVFEYRTGLRSESDPNYDGVARMLRGNDPRVQQLAVEPGTLNVFRGKNTAHRVTPVEGPTDRIIAVFSYYEAQDVRFSAAEQIGFYGRAAE